MRQIRLKQQYCLKRERDSRCFWAETVNECIRSAELEAGDGFWYVCFIRGPEYRAQMTGETTYRTVHPKGEKCKATKAR